MEKSNKSKPQPNRKPLVSVIITTKNEEEVLERLLKSIEKQSYPKIEVIVVDNQSSDNTKKIAKKYTNKIYDYGPERSFQRNFGAKKSKGKYLLFLDADMELSKNVVSECVDVAGSNGKIGGLIIPEEPVARTFWEKVKAHERFIYNVEGDPITDAARFFTRKAFYAAGGYDESITGPEDWDLPETVKKKGYKIGRISSKIKHFERVPNPFVLAKKKYYYGIKSHRYLAKHNISAISPKTIYFLRPIFYKNWRMLIAHPILSFAMFVMFTLELFGGGLGYMVGKAKDK